MSETSKDEVIVSGNSGQKKKLIRTILISGAAIFIVAILVGVLVLGYMTVVWKRPAQTVVLTSAVCNDGIVTTYNSAAAYMRRDTSGKDVVDEKGLKALVTTIKSKAGYENDPTCQMIVLMAALHSNDYTAARQAYDAVKKLHTEHRYIDNNLNTGGSLSAYELFVRQLSPSNQSDQEPKGGA